MQHLKNTVLLSLLALIAAPALGSELRVDCDLSQTAFGYEHRVERITLQTGTPGSLQVEYQDGTIENLPPVPGQGGTFGEINFPANFKEPFGTEDSYAQVSSNQLGVIQMVHRCKSAMDSAYFCNSREGSATHEFVRFNVGGKLLIFNGNSLPLCRRFSL